MHLSGNPGKREQDTLVSYTRSIPPLFSLHRPPVLLDTQPSCVRFQSNPSSGGNPDRSESAMICLLSCQELVCEHVVQKSSYHRDNSGWGLLGKASCAKTQPPFSHWTLLCLYVIPGAAMCILLPVWSWSQGLDHGEVERWREAGPSWHWWVPGNPVYWVFQDLWWYELMNF